MKKSTSQFMPPGTVIPGFLGLVLVVLLLTSQHSPAAMYKWVDENGNVTYSEKKPPGKPAQEIKKHSFGAGEGSAQSKLDELTDKADAQKERRDFAEDYASQQVERNNRIKKNCEIARNNLNILEIASRVKDVDADGNEYFVEDTDRAARIDKSRANVAKYCN